jgi:hypothetical protein
MSSSRLLLITILATGGFYVAGFVALGSGYPTAESTGDEIVQWFVDNGSSARVYAWTAAFVSLGLGIFGGQVSALFPKPHRYIFLAGVLGFAITAQVQAWFWAGLALHPEGLDPGAARTIFDIPNYWGPLVNGSTTTMAIAVAALGLGASPLVPRWLMWLSVLFFAEQAIETVTVFGKSGFIAPDGAMNVYLGGVIGFAWTGGLVYWAMKRMDSNPPPESPGARSTPRAT